MANERLLGSPGFFPNVIDLTGRPADPPGIGAAIVGPRAQGPAMIPVRLRSGDDDLLIFGAPRATGKDFAAYAAQSYLDLKTNPLTFVRVLGMADTGVQPGWTEPGASAGLYALVASGSNAVALIYSSGAVTLQGTLTSSVSSLALNIPGWQSVTASVLRGDQNYIKKVLNTDPSQYSTYKHFVYAVYDYGQKTPGGGNAFYVQQLLGSNDFQDEFITGSTTNIISQPFNTIEYNLFGIGSLNAGDSSNKLVKVSVRDIRKSVNESQYEYGSFTLVVRDYEDNDKNPVILETFANLTLDPESANYVCKRIGDKYRVWNKSTKKFDEYGDFENMSKFIYVIPTIDLKNKNVPTTALPWGFAGYRTVFSGAIGGRGTFPDLSFVNNLLYKNDFSTRVYWGAQIINNASGAFQYGMDDKVKHLPSAFFAVSGATGQQFSLKWISGAVNLVSSYSDQTRLTEAQVNSMSTSIQMNSGSSFPASSGSSGFTGFFSVGNLENTSLAKFTLPIQNGFDGVDVRKVNPFDPANMGSTTAYETYAYRTAIDMLANADDVEITDLVLPGVYRDKVADYALAMVENRGDLFYIMDFSGSTVSDILADVSSRNVDSPFAATYYSSLILKDRRLNKNVEVPASTVMPAVFAYNDSVAFPWFAPAGFSRGGLARHGVQRAKDKLQKSERDKLYDNRINPIGTFNSSGTVVWGQKTLQVADSARNRINVMRMILKLQKTLSPIALNIVFEPNLATTWDKFVQPATKELSKIRANFGIDEFKLILDSSTTTEDYIERNIIYGKLGIKPTRAAEFIWLDIIVSNNLFAFA